MNLHMSLWELLVMQGLCHWRDYVARAEDESTGYILPNKTLLEIAKEMPLTSDKLLRLVKSRHSVMERYLPAVLDIIRNSISQSAAFEAIAMQLKQAQLEKVYYAFLSCFLSSSTCLFEIVVKVSITGNCLQARVAEIEAKGSLIGAVEPLTAQTNLPALEIPQLVIPVAQVNASAMVNYSSTYHSNIPSASQKAPLISAHQGQKPVTASLYVSETKSAATVSGSASQQNIGSGSTPAVSTFSCYYPTSTNGLLFLICYE